MKKKIILFMGVVYFVSIFAVEMNLKYSSVNLSRCTEVSGLVNFYKKTIDEMQEKDGTVRARVDSLIRNLSKNEKYRILYLDWYVNHNYPEFYKEFFFINSIFTRPVESGLYSEEDIYNYSIYPRKWIEPYFTKEVTPTNVLPSLVEIREKVWKSVIEVEPEFTLLNESNTFNIWAKVKFVSYEKINIERNDCPQLIKAKCKVVDSSNSEIDGKILDLTISMFGDDRELSFEQNYLVNYGYSFSLYATKNLNKPEINIPQMKFVSQVNRIYSLGNDDEIIFSKPKTKFYNDYHPLKGMSFNNSTKLFEEIKYLKNLLKAKSGQ